MAAELRKARLTGGPVQGPAKTMRAKLADRSHLSVSRPATGNSDQEGLPALGYHGRHQVASGPEQGTCLAYGRSRTAPKQMEMRYGAQPAKVKAAPAKGPRKNNFSETAVVS